MFTSKVVATFSRFSSRTFVTRPQTVTKKVNNRQFNCRLSRFWSQLRNLIGKNFAKNQPNNEPHHLVKWVRRHPDQSPISYWNQILSRQFLLRARNFFAFGLVGVALQNDGLSGATLLTYSDEEDAKLDRIRLMFSKIWYEKNNNSRQDVPFDFGLDKLNFSKCIAKGCNAAVYEAKVDETKETVAVKMMFNYEAETNAAAVLKAMEMECVPFPGEFSGITLSHDKERFKIPGHSNIIDIKGIFADWTPLLPNAYDLYPSALPARLNRESGLGRNMTLFLVMKKYDISLKDFLLLNTPSHETSLILLTQLMEGVDFLQSHKVTHRDLKSDNLLLDLSHGNEYPRLVISDFGCCLTSLSLYYPSDEISKGGNLAHMPPEVISAKPGPLSTINYSSADLWSSAAIAYELWGYPNPAISRRKSQFLSFSSNGYKIEKLEKINEAPEALNKLLHDILMNDPYNRPTTRTAITLCHLILFIPSRHRKIAKALKPQVKIKYFLEFLVRKKYPMVEGNSVLRDLMTMLLAQVTYKDVYSAVQYL